MMPSHVLYEIPTATWPIRLLMGVVCALFVTGIFGWWLPRAVPKLLTLPRASASQTVVNWVLAWAPVVIGFGPLVVLISLIRNPIAYVTDTGVMQESVFSNTPVSFTWGEIARVNCRVGRNGVPVSIAVVGTDGQMIGFGNTGGVDFASMHELFENQLGPHVVRPCTRSR